MICYKIVSKKRRYGTNLSLFLRNNRFSSRKNLLRYHSVLKDYFPLYFKGRIITSVKGSPGIMVFDSIDNAIRFMVESGLTTICKIIKVKGIKRLPQSCIISSCGSKPQKLLTQASKYMTPPEGTLFFKEVKVLE